MLSQIKMMNEFSTTQFLAEAMKQKNPDQAFVKKTLKAFEQSNQKNILISKSILTESYQRDREAALEE